MTEKKAKRLIKDISFEHQGAHVALVHELQGGPANEYTTLLTKASDEVTVQLSFKEFLTRFFDLWSDEADLLSAALGFDIDYDDWEEGWSYKDWIESKASRISIMKSLFAGEKSPESLEDEDFKFIFKAKGLFEKLITSEATPEDNSSEDIEKSSVNKPVKEEETTMTKEEIAALEEELRKAKEDAASTEAVKAELEKAAVELEELRKEKEELRKQKEEQTRSEMKELVKGYSFISDELQDKVVEALLKSDEVMIEVLEKAGEAIKAAAETEKGVTSEVEAGSTVEKSRSRVREIIKNRKSKS